MRALVAAWLVALTLAACGETPTLTPLSRNAVVLAFGDSLTFGTGARNDASYPARLQALLGRRVINAGLPGETATAGVARLPGVLDEHHPALVVLCHGGNDILRGRSMAGLEHDLGAMVDLIRARGADVVMLGVPGRNLTLRPPGAYARVAAEHGLPLDDTTLPELMSDPTMKSDQVHLNARGYARLAHAAFDLISEAGGLRDAP